MTSINTSIWSSALSGVYAQGAISTAMDSSLLRIYTGNRINQASDDPQGLVDVVDVDRRISSAHMAIQNNQASLSSLSRVESALHVMLGNLLDIRDAVQKSIGVFDTGTQQTLLDTVTDLINMFDQHARTTQVGSQAVLAGGAEISLGSDAADLLDTDATHVRRAGRSLTRSIRFSSADAAEQAVIRDTYNIPAADSDLKITTDKGSVQITIAAGTGAAAAASQINSAIADIGGTAVEDTGDIVIHTRDFGQDKSIRFDTVSGPNIFGSATISDTGVDGKVNINGANFTLKGDLTLNYGDVNFSGNLAFSQSKVGVNAVSGASPADAFIDITASGGLLLQFGENGGSLDAARFGFRNLTAQELGLSRIVQNSDPAYMLSDPDAAIAIIMSAYDTVNQSLSELGDAMGYDLQGMSQRLQDMLGNLYDQRSTIMDTDHAYEAARMAKLQMLQQAGLSAMSADISTRQSMMSLFDVMLPR